MHVNHAVRSPKIDSSLVDIYPVICQCTDFRLSSVVLVTVCYRISSDGSWLLYLPSSDSGQFAHIRLSVQPRHRANRLRVGADAVVGGRPTGPNCPSNAVRLRRRPPAPRCRRRVDLDARRQRRRLAGTPVSGLRRPARADFIDQVVAGESECDGMRWRRPSLGGLRLRRQQGRHWSGTSWSRRLRSTLSHRVPRYARNTVLITWRWNMVIFYRRVPYSQRYLFNANPDTNHNPNPYSTNPTTKYRL